MTEQEAKAGLWKNEVPFLEVTVPEDQIILVSVCWINCLNDRIFAVAPFEILWSSPSGLIILTINVPLFKKLRDITFFCGTITLCAMSRKMAHKVIAPQKKIRSQSFLNSGTLLVSFVSECCCALLLCVVVCCWVFLCVVVCCCVLQGSPCSYMWAGIEGGGGWLPGLPLPPHHYSLGIHGCLLVGGGVL